MSSQTQPIYTPNAIDYDVDIQARLDQACAKTLSDFYDEHQLMYPRASVIYKLALANMARALLEFAQTGSTDSDIPEAIPNHDHTGYKVVSNKISTIFLNAFNANGRFAKSINFFSEEEHKNLAFVAFGKFSLGFITRRFSYLKLSPPA